MSGSASVYETGLDYFGARYFSGAQGRFTSVDPVLLSKQKLRDPQQWNLYAYVRNNPLKYVDPTGMVLEVAGDEETRKRVLADIQRTVSEAKRASVNLIEGNGKNGLQKGRFYIDAKSLNSAKANEDSNFHALRQIANSSGTVSATVLNGATTMRMVESNGRPMETSFAALNAGVSQQQLNAGEGVTGITAIIPAALSGVDRGTNTSAVPGVTTVFINGQIQNPITEAVAMAHELYGHALRALLGGGGQVYHNTVGDAFDQMVDAIERQTRINAGGR